MIILGIDPGLFGALAVLDSETGEVLDLLDTPILTVGTSKKSKNDFQIVTMVKMVEKQIQRLGPVLPTPERICAGLESVHAMPGQGVTSMFNMGRGVGLWEGVLSALKVSYTKVAPQTWKKRLMGDMGRDKEASRLRAQQLFPTTELHLKKHHGRAEALLIAEFIRRSRVNNHLS